MEDGSDDLNARFVKKADGKVLLEVTGITAENMDKTVTVNITGLGTVTFNGNAFAKAMANSGNTDQRNLGAALYNYGVAANACFAQESAGLEAPPPKPVIVPNIFLENLHSAITLVDGDVVTGTFADNYKISVADGAAITLMDANITLPNSSQYAGLNLLGSATIIIEGANTVTGAYEEYPGIYVPQNQTLTIDGTGSLDASSNGWACGIGGGYGSQQRAGNIVINGGTITATGGMFAAGIGSGRFGECGTIKITNGVTQVIATKGGGAPDSIGKGNNGKCGTITIDPAANVTQN